MGATSLINFEDIVADCLPVAEIVHTAVDLYLIRLLLFPVKAIVVAFVSTTVPLTVGEHALEDAVAVNVQVLAVPKTVVLLELLYVLQVIVQVPVFALGICA